MVNDSELSSCFAQCIRCAVRLVHLQELQAPEMVIENERSLLLSAVGRLNYHAYTVARAAVAQQVGQIKNSCPCFYCGHHVADTDLSSDSLDSKCLKEHDLESMFNTVGSTCTDYSPEGAILPRTNIVDEIAAVQERYNKENLLKAFREVGNSMAGHVNLLLALFPAEASAQSKNK